MTERNELSAVIRDVINSANLQEDIWSDDAADAILTRWRLTRIPSLAKDNIGQQPCEARDPSGGYVCQLPLSHRSRHYAQDADGYTWFLTEQEIEEQCVTPLMH